MSDYTDHYSAAVPFKVINAETGQCVGQFATLSSAEANVKGLRALSSYADHFDILEVRWLTGTKTLADRKTG
jgi:hypothetical protein